MKAIQLALVSVYKETNGMLSNTKVVDVLRRFQSVNPSAPLLPLGQAHLEQMLGDWAACGHVALSIGGAVSLTQTGKDHVEQSGVLDEWQQFENAMRK